MPRLSQRTLRRILALATLTLLSAAFALAQSTSNPTNRNLAKQATRDWSYAATIAPVHRKLFLVTMADPIHRHRCFVQSITPDQLLCRGALNRMHMYNPQDVAALILPDAKVRGLSRVMVIAGTALLATIALTPTCPLCAVATEATALALMFAAEVMAIADHRPETLLYLAPNQTLHVDLRY